MIMNDENSIRRKHSLGHGAKSLEIPLLAGRATRLPGKPTPRDYYTYMPQLPRPSVRIDYYGRLTVVLSTFTRRAITIDGSSLAVHECYRTYAVVDTVPGFHTPRAAASPRTHALREGS